VDWAARICAPQNRAQTSELVLCSIVCLRVRYVCVQELPE
jgi:hypothetical protein